METTNIRFHWNLADSERNVGIPWNSNGNCSRRLPDSDCFREIPADSIGISMEFQSGMAEAQAIWIPLEFRGIPWNSDIPLGICRIPPELRGDGKDLNYLSTAYVIQ